MIHDILRVNHTFLLYVGFSLLRKGQHVDEQNHKQKGERKKKELLIHDRLYSFDKC